MRYALTLFWLAISFSLLRNAFVMAMPRNPAHEQLLKFTEEQRKAAWTMLLQKSGERCDHATRTFFQMQDLDGRAYWDVACANGRAYKIRINTDRHGSTSISDCALMKRLTGTACFERMKDVPKGWIAGP
jgi:hypothetical protein